MIDRFDQLWVWSDRALAARLGWYRDVASGRRPPKFRLARTLAANVDLTRADEPTLWSELARLTPAFIERWQNAKRGHPVDLTRAPRPDVVDLCRELAYRMLAHCNFCEWHCRVDRAQATKFGTCRLAGETRVSSYFHHGGEELVYRGTHGSGTIFFTSCNMRCAFCQNGDISTDKDNGSSVNADELATMAWLLWREGCHNTNWVGGEVTIHLHTVIDAISRLSDDGFRPTKISLQRALATKADPFVLLDEPARAGRVFNSPQLWNSNFYMSEEAMRLLRLLMDVWLPAFKFGPGRCAITLARTPKYWETVTRNLRLIHEWGEDLTIRHLVMPEHVMCCTYPVLDWISMHMPDVPVNIMDQYHPDNFCDPDGEKYDARYAAIARRPHGDEVRAAYDYADRLGLAYRAITHEKRWGGLWS